MASPTYRAVARAAFAAGVGLGAGANWLAHCALDWPLSWLAVAWMVIVALVAVAASG